jgi:hypothetical protein
MAAYLILNGVIMPVAAETPSATVEEIGDAVFTHSGAHVAKVRARRRAWDVATRWLLPAQASAIRTALFAQLPHLATGDLMGGNNVSVVTELQEESMTSVRGARLRSFRFRLVEV